MFLLEAATAARPDRGLWSTTGFTPGSRNLAAGIASAGAWPAWSPASPAATCRRCCRRPRPRARAAAASWPCRTSPASARRCSTPTPAALIAGLTAGHGRGQVLRALLEAAAYAVRHNLEVMAEAGARIGALRASGGGTPKPVAAHRERRHGAAAGGAPRGRRRRPGGALLAAVATGAATLDTAWVSAHVRIAPDPAPRALYDELYGVYRDLYPATAGALHTLAALQRGLGAGGGKGG